MTVTDFEKNKLMINAMLDEVDSIREGVNEVLTEMLKQATLEASAMYPGHRVTTVSAMGSWSITVHDVDFKEDPMGLGQPIRPVEFVSADPEHDEKECPTLAVLDDVWDKLQTYPTIRFDIDAAGTLTSATDW